MFFVKFLVPSRGFDWKPMKFTNIAFAVIVFSPLAGIRLETSNHISDTAKRVVFSPLAGIRLETLSPILELTTMTTLFLVPSRGFDWKPYAFESLARN